MSTIRRKLKTDELLYFTQSLNEDWTDPEIQGNTTPVYAKEILNNFVTQKINNRLLGFKQDEFEIHYIFENKQFIIESEELDFKDVYTSNSDLAARAESAFDKFLQTVSKYSPDASEKLVQKIENIIVLSGLVLMVLAVPLRNFRLAWLSMSILGITIAVIQFWKTVHSGKFSATGRYQKRSTVYTGKRAVFWSAITSAILFFSCAAMLITLVLSV